MHYGLSTGLASNEVTNAYQDEAGYMWIGTNNGLQRFDGTRYKTFVHGRMTLHLFLIIILRKYYLIRKIIYG